MIKVKAIKESQQDVQPTREDYVLEEKEKRRFAPLAFLLFLTGFAVYLRSFFPAQPEASPGQQANRRPVDEANPETLAKEGEDICAETEVDATGTADHAKKSSDNVVEISSRARSPRVPDNFLASDSPSIDFSGQRPFSQVETGPTGDQRPSNDNQFGGRPISGAGSAGGGGGGSGGGGGGSGGLPGNPPGPDPDPLRNRAPRISGPVRLQDLVGCHAYLISVLALLAGTTDPDGDQLRVLNFSASSGSLVPAEGGGWLFTPDPGMLGDVTLTYSISDGAESVQQVAYFSIIEAPPIVGTDCADNLLGTECRDVIDGRNGDDNIDARGGNDVVIGGDGDDHIVGGAGDDVIYAGAGDDIVFAGSGNDIVFGGLGNDRLFGEDGNDTIYGEQGDDLIVGGAGDDILLGGSENDTVNGDEGNDVVDGGEGLDNLHGGAGQDVMLARGGNDIVHGDDGDDVLSDGAGEDVVSGGEGNDHVMAAADAASDSYSGDAGEDTLDYSSATLSIVIDVGRGSAESLEIGKDLISGFEKIISGQGNDHITAGSTSIVITGGDGDDTFEFNSSDRDYQPDLVRKITDFTIGDRIVAASYEIHYRQDGNSETISDLFNDIYLSNNEGHRPIRFRFEKLDGADLTFVDVNQGDGPESYYTIELLGHHELEFTVVVSPAVNAAA